MENFRKTILGLIICLSVLEFRREIERDSVCVCERERERERERETVCERWRAIT